MKKKRKLKKGLVLIIVIVLVLIIIFVCSTMLKKNKKPNEVKVEDQVETYGYTLDDNETSYYKDLFKKLKEVLNADTVDYEEYAKLVSQLFVADFFNLDNKVSNSDIGGIQFVYNDYRDSFMKFAKESIYHIVKNNLYGDRNQKLPIVSEVSVDKIEVDSVSYLDKSDKEGYVVDVTISYKEDLGYQEKATLYLVHADEKLEIVRMSK